jgi:glycerol-3-phosphate acyltransferase PlsX
MPVLPIAVDATGADHGPAELVTGAVAAAGAGNPAVVVGPAALLEPLVPAGSGVELVDADGPDPARASRGASSIAVAAGLVAEGRAAALVSAGPTGAVVATAALRLGRLPGVQRPAIAVVLPAPAGPVVLLDAGASPEVTPAVLAQFGAMGAAYAELVLGIEAPRVGLLNIGSEPGKGGELQRGANAAMAALPGFAGNVEGNDLWRGAVDVVVTDGFTGNVVLKAVEATLGVAMGSVKAALEAGVPARLAAAVLAPRLRALARRFDPDEHGGAALLGVAGPVVVTHGAARAKAVTAACRAARRAADAGLPGRIAARLTGSAAGDLGA